MSKILDLDLNANPAVKDLLADLEPGAKLVIRATLKSKDDQTAQVRIMKVEEDETPEEEDAEEGEEEGETDDEMGEMGGNMMEDDNHQM